MKNARITRLFYYILLLSLVLMSDRFNSTSYAGDFPQIPNPLPYAMGGSGYTGQIQVPACTMYASPSGSGTTCTAATPCTAQQGLLNVTTSNNVLCLNNGTYPYVSGAATLVVGIGGTSAAPLWIRPTNLNGNVIASATTVNTPTVKITTASSGSRDGIRVYQANPNGWVVIYGLELDGSADVTTADQPYGINFSGYITGNNPIVHVYAINNLVHNWGGSGIQCNYGDYCTIINNISHDNAALQTTCASNIGFYESTNYDQAPGFHNFVEGNISYNASQPTSGCWDGQGIFVEDDGDHSQGNNIPYTGSTLVENNLSYNNKGSGIKVFNTTHAFELIRNNTTYHNYTSNLAGGPPQGGSGEIVMQGAANVIITNNIVWPSASGGTVSGNDVGLGEWGVPWLGQTNGVQWQGNMCNTDAGAQACWFSTTASVSDVSPAVNNTFFVNPLFNNAGTNFSLQITSPAIHNGRTQYGQPLVDMLGVQRDPDLIDLGAFTTTTLPIQPIIAQSNTTGNEPQMQTPVTLQPIRGILPALFGVTEQGGQRNYGSILNQFIGTPSAPIIYSGFTSGTTDYYWCVAQDINTAETLVSAGTGTTGTTGTMACGPQPGATQYCLLRTASSTPPSGTSSVLVGCQSTASNQPDLISDAGNTLTSYTIVTVDNTGWYLGNQGQIGFEEFNDTQGLSMFLVENRGGATGALINTTGATNAITELGMKNSGGNLTFRYEGRGSSFWLNPNESSQGEFQFVDPFNSPFFDVGIGSAGVTTARGAYTSVEVTAPSGIANSDILYADSTAHQWKAKSNNGSATFVQLGTVAWAAPQATLSWDGFLGEMTTSARKAAIMPNAGHFTNLTCTATFTGTCTTTPKFNVVDITGSTSGTQTAGVTSTVATLVSQSQTLTFNAGDTVGISVSSAGATCTVPQFSCVATYTQP